MLTFQFDFWFIWMQTPWISTVLVANIHVISDSTWSRFQSVITFPISDWLISLCAGAGQHGTDFFVTVSWILNIHVAYCTTVQDHMIGLYLMVLHPIAWLCPRVFVTSSNGRFARHVYCATNKQDTPKKLSACNSLNHQGWIHVFVVCWKFHTKTRPKALLPR